MLCSSRLIFFTRILQDLLTRHEDAVSEFLISHYEQVGENDIFFSEMGEFHHVHVNKIKCSSVDLSTFGTVLIM
jgi:hypothetical protein